MAQVAWSRRALNSFDEVLEYSRANFSAGATDRLVERILGTVDRLEQFPLSGFVVMEFGRESIREVFAKPYRVICRVEGDSCVIADIVHGSRLMPAEVADQ